MKIEKYNITLQYVEEEDAELIIQLRTDNKRSRFISPTKNNIESQKDWLRNYKLREGNKSELYFIGVDENGEKFATYRIYNIEDDICEIGSWVSKPNYGNPNNSIKMDIIMKEYVFENLGFDQLRFEVNKKNTSVVRYHKLFGPEIVSETDDSYYFILKKDRFVKQRNQVFKNIK